MLRNVKTRSSVPSATCVALRHAKLNFIASFSIADVVSSQRQGTLLGAFCSTALSITVSFSTFSSLLVNTCFTWETPAIRLFRKPDQLFVGRLAQGHSCHVANGYLSWPRGSRALLSSALLEDYHGQHAVANGIVRQDFLLEVPFAQLKHYTHVTS